MNIISISHLDIDEIICFNLMLYYHKNKIDLHISKVTFQTLVICITSLLYAGLMKKYNIICLLEAWLKKFFCRLDDDVVISGRQENNSFGWNKVGLEISQDKYDDVYKIFAMSLPCTCTYFNNKSNIGSWFLHAM